MTRLGDFSNFWATIFLTTVAQIFGNFLGSFEILYYSHRKNCCGYLLGNCSKIWDTLYSNIWSHWCGRAYLSPLIFRDVELPAVGMATVENGVVDELRHAGGVAKETATLLGHVALKNNKPGFKYMCLGKAKGMKI